MRFVTVRAREFAGPARARRPRDAVGAGVTRLKAALDVPGRGRFSAMRVF